MLNGRFVDLVPLDRAHAADLYAVSGEGDLFRYLPIAGFGGVADVETWIDEANAAAAGGRELPFAVVWKESGRAIGSTRYLDINPDERALEVGWTWIGRPFQRTGANVEAKYLMMRHAFEERGFLRVAFYTDAQNGRSRAALVRIGAVYEGTLRSHRARAANDFVRDSAVYSVVSTEWVAVRTRLEMKLRSTAPRLRSV